MKKKSTQLPTAEQFLKDYSYVGKEVPIALIKFAKLHVKAALKAASQKAEIIDDPNSYTGNTGSEYPADQIVSQESILNAYPVKLIK